MLETNPPQPILTKLLDIIDTHEISTRACMGPCIHPAGLWPCRAAPAMPVRWPRPWRHRRKGWRIQDKGRGGSCVGVLRVARWWFQTFYVFIPHNLEDFLKEHCMWEASSRAAKPSSFGVATCGLNRVHQSWDWSGIPAGDIFSKLEWNTHYTWPKIIWITEVFKW